MGGPPPRLLLIDGYSLLHRDPELAPILRSNLALARELLVRKLERAIPDLADRVTVVFDGRRGRDEAPRAAGLVEVEYAPSHLTADTVIERAVHRAASPERITVVTNDRAERDTVSAAGASVMSCIALLEQLAKPPRSAGGPGIGGARTFRPRLGEIFPPSAGGEKSA